MVAAIHTPVFPRTLVAFINTALPFDYALVLGYSRNHKPIYLYDSLTEQRQVLFEHYLHQAYREDPFYQAVQAGVASGIYLLSELFPRFFTRSDYYRGFYQNTGWRDEVGIISRVNDEVTVVFSLGRLGQRTAPGQEQLAPLRQFEPLFQNLCLQHWGALAKLNLSSQADLFLMFLNHLITLDGIAFQGNP